MHYGIMTPLVTPVDSSGKVKEKVLVDLIEDQISKGIHSLLAVGGSGETLAVPIEMRKQVVEIFVKTVKNRVPVVAGVSELGLINAIRTSQMCRDAGADAIIVATPWGDDNTTQGCVDFYGAIYDAVKMPILIYNYPGRNNYGTPPDVIEALLNHVPGIDGMKECSFKFEQTLELIARFGDRMEVLSGCERHCAWDLLAGAKGAIMASANVIPGEWVKMYGLAKAGRLDELREMAFKYMPLQKKLFGSGVQNPGPLKYVLTRQGFDVGEPMIPVCKIPEGFKAELDAMMKELNML